MSGTMFRQLMVICAVAEEEEEELNIHRLLLNNRMDTSHAPIPGTPHEKEPLLTGTTYKESSLLRLLLLLLCPSAPLSAQV